jgi:gliding motility-associated-like protein
VKSTFQLKKTHFVIFLLNLFLACNQTYSQAPINNKCDSAIFLCPQIIASGTTRNADVDTCQNCSDIDLFGSGALQSTIWYEFNTNQIGDSLLVTLDLLAIPAGIEVGGVIQLRLLKKNNSCIRSDFQPVESTFSATSIDTTFIFTSLDPNSNYGIIINENSFGVSDPGVDFSIKINGKAVDLSLPAGNIQFPDTICINEKASFNLALTNCSNPTSIQWLINENIISSGGSLVFETTELSNGDSVKAIVTCSSDCVEPIVISSEPIFVFSFSIDAGNDTIINPGEIAQLHASTDSPNFYWDTELFISSTSVLEPFVYPEETFTYPFVAYFNSCVLYDYVTVFVREGLEIPNTFSPNGDNLNDSWKIPDIELYPKNRMSIYNRYGLLLESYEPYTPASQWTGIWQGAALPEGVYFYILELNDSQNTIYKSTISIIR